ncbi:hypothetical protein FA09DRAFT_57560 [Tilletiopsis washingtonensis]|uniref:Uncharacterized protein n=1 Tax=Tilletiopsis washingtonensis TaxID=58919 RepID=A0A316Z7R0_9BASI|nr:hypothetical protein FA09DRAFT_57560 [Tilletiopsis washingtonensis]PWN97018.1 hypothetical protein FA09DRAFT_57560 [Tilletiopsis washingtonensis]
MRDAAGVTDGSQDAAPPCAWPGRPCMMRPHTASRGAAAPAACGAPARVPQKESLGRSARRKGTGSGSMAPPYAASRPACCPSQPSCEA